MGEQGRALAAGVALLERAINYALGSLRIVTPSALCHATPCSGWNLQKLLEHLDDSLLTLNEAATGHIPTPPPTLGRDLRQAIPRQPSPERGGELRAYDPASPTRGGNPPNYGQGEAGGAGSQGRGRGEGGGIGGSLSDGRGEAGRGAGSRGRGQGEAGRGANSPEHGRNETGSPVGPKPSAGTGSSAEPGSPVGPESSAGLRSPIGSEPPVGSEPAVGSGSPVGPDPFVGSGPFVDPRASLGRQPALSPGPSLDPEPSCGQGPVPSRKPRTPGSSLSSQPTAEPGAFLGSQPIMGPGASVGSQPVLGSGAFIGAGAFAGVQPSAATWAGNPALLLRDSATEVLGRWAAMVTDDLVSIDDRHLTSPMVAAVGAIEIAVHGWDVARACGEHRPIPRLLTEELLDLALLFVTNQDRPSRFGPPVRVPAGAPAQDHLLAYLGRDPDWFAHN